MGEKRGGVSLVVNCVRDRSRSRVISMDDMNTYTVFQPPQLSLRFGRPTEMGLQARCSSGHGALPAGYDGGGECGREVRGARLRMTSDDLCPRREGKTGAKAVWGEDELSVHMAASFRAELRRRCGQWRYRMGTEMCLAGTQCLKTPVGTFRGRKVGLMNVTAPLLLDTSLFRSQTAIGTQLLLSSPPPLNCHGRYAHQFLRSTPSVLTSSWTRPVIRHRAFPSEVVQPQGTERCDRRWACISRVRSERGLSTVAEHAPFTDRDPS